LPGSENFDGVAGLRLALLSRPDVFATTATEKLLIYALGRGLEASDASAVRTIIRSAGDDNYKLSSLILGVIKSAPFQLRRSQA